MYKNLSEYISRLDAIGELKRITVRVDPLYEIAEITDRISKTHGGGKALLFEDTGTGFPVLVNMMGSDRRIAEALGVRDIGDIPLRISDIVGKLMSPKSSYFDKMKLLPLLADMARWMPKESSARGECQQVVMKGEDVDLGRLPILKCWPYDGGRFVTLPMVNTVDPATGVRNVGMYRMQVVDEKTTGMHWHMHKTGERHYMEYKKRGMMMPVSVCLGGDPVYTYSSTAPLPDNIDEYMLAGFLRGRPVKLVKCITNDLMVPADCDIVIEGYVDPSEDKFMEGPFGDHTGFYSLEDLYPKFHVTAVTHREGAVYPATLVGVPPQEDAYIAKATEKIFIEPIRLALLPEVKDLYMPEAGVAHNLAIVSINKTFAGQAFKAASALWGAGQMMFNKILLVCNGDTDIRCPEKIGALLRNIAPHRDVMIIKGVADVLDHSVAQKGVGGKMVIDLTSCGNHSHNAEDKGGSEVDPALLENADASYIDRWGVMIFFANPDDDINRSQLAEQVCGISGVKFIVVADKAARSLDGYEMLWLALAGIDPMRDVTVECNMLIMDCRTKIAGKDGYPLRTPNVVSSSPDTVSLVDRRWEDYGLGEFIQSPSRKYFLLTGKNGSEY